MVTIFISLGVILAIFLVVVATRPNDYTVSRSLNVSASAADAFAQVNDFHHWEAWSPWAKLDPAARNFYEGPTAGEGAKFSWDGNRKVGAGRMTIAQSQPNEVIRINLEFVRPFAGVCLAEFSFKPLGDQTGVTWSMSGKNNFIGKAFCMFLNMDMTLGGQFEKGLAQLKAVTESAKQSRA